MKKQSEQAVALFENGFNCAQAVLLAFSGDKEVCPTTAARLASGFGGGMGCMAGTCGAVTGAYMILGLRHGPATGNDKAAKEAVYRLVREFAARFRERNKSVDCRELLGCDISTADGMAAARAKGLFGSVCPRMVKDAAEILEEMACPAG